MAQALQRGQSVDAAYGVEKAGLLMASLRFWLHLGPRETFCAVMAVCSMATPQLIALPWLKNRYVYTETSAREEDWGRYRSRCCYLCIIRCISVPEDPLLHSPVEE